MNKANTYQVVSGNSEFNFSADDLNTFGIYPSGPDKFILSINNINYKVELLECDWNASRVKLQINNTKRWVTIKNKVQQEIEKLGYDNSKILHSDELKSPMPGLVIDVLAVSGQTVCKGDHLITLEAMKMENILRAQHDGVIDKVLVFPTDKVEKNQTLITFKQKTT